MDFHVWCKQQGVCSLKFDFASSMVPLYLGTALMPDIGTIL